MAKALSVELSSRAFEVQISDGCRLERAWAACDQLKPMPAPMQLPSLADGGAIVITGGAGGIGLIVAQHLVSLGRTRLVLIGRTRLAPATGWSGVLGRGL